MATVGTWQWLDDPILVCAASELPFFERVRLEAVGSRFHRLVFHDRRRLMLTIEQELKRDLPADFNNRHYLHWAYEILETHRYPELLYFHVRIERQTESHKGSHLQRTVMEMKGLKQMLQGVMARVKNWRHISINNIDYGKGRLIPILDWLAEAVKVTRFSADFHASGDNQPQASEVERLAQWIGQYSVLLRHLNLWLHLILDGASVQLIVQAIGQCQKLRRLTISDSSISDSPTFRDMIVQLPKLNGFSAGYYASAAHAISINESWLEFCAQPAFRLLLGRMKHFNLRLSNHHLPLPAASMANVFQVILAMQQPVKIKAFGQLSETEEVVKLDKMLAQWLHLAKDTDANILLDTDGWDLSVDQYMEAMAALPSDLRNGGRLHMPKLAEIRAGDQPLTFYYTGMGNGNGGGIVTLKDCHFEATEATLSLKLLCEKRLLHMLTVSNACQFFMVASKSNSDSLKQAAGKLVWDKMETAEQLVGWNQYINGDFALLLELCKMKAKKLFY